MIWAIKNNEKITANPFISGAKCPYCNSEVIAKCGNIKIWHWAHKIDCDCDLWHENETEWHINWKSNFPKENQEVIIEKENIKHIADIKLKDVVIEFQNSPISSNDIQNREKFYEKIKWVINGETFAKNLNLFAKNGFYSFKWKWFPKSWLISNKEIYIDLSFKIKDIKKEIQEYNNGKKHISTILEKTYEWEDDYGNIREGEYPHYYKSGIEDTELYVLNLKKTLEFYNKNNIFLIKKLSYAGTGWGKFIDKDIFIKEVKYGYYRNK